MNSRTPRLLFLTGTRADFGKLKALIMACEEMKSLETYVFITGMHLEKKFGYTASEVLKCNFKNTYQFVNHEEICHMDRVVARTIDGLSAMYLNLK